MDRITRFLNGNEEIKKAISLYIEAFVKFYGEERRQEIEEKFNNLLCIGYQTPDAIKSGLRTLEEQKTKELMEPIFEDIELPLNSIIGTLTLSSKNHMPINYLYELMDSYRMGAEGRKKQFYTNAFEILNNRLNMTQEEFEELITTKQLPERYQNKSAVVKDYIMNVIDDSKIENDYKRQFSLAKSLLETIIPGINENNFEELLNNDIIEKLMNVRDKIEEANEKYLTELKPLQDEVKDIESLQRNLKDKLYREFLKENISLFPENLKEKIEKYLNDETSLLAYDIRKIVGLSLESDGYLNAFSDDADNILSDSNSSSWKINSIKKERINYFKTMGLDLGDDYDNYMRSEEARKLIPTKESIKKIIESKNSYLNKYNNIFYTSLERHKHLLSEIAEIGFMDKDDPINAMTYVEGVSYISSNFIRTEGGYISYPILCINFSNFNTSYLDHTIVHELNHVFESSMGLVGEHEYEFICGWDVTTENLNIISGQEVNTLESRANRPYELFNEIINELIAQEISKIMHEENIYIFDEEDNSTYKYTTNYDYTKFLVQDFFDEFRDAIIESRSNGNIEVIFNEVGKENFDALNELFHIYNESFTGIKMVNLYTSLQEGKETEATRLYYELIERRDRILENMRKYRDSHKKEVKEAEV